MSRPIVLTSPMDGTPQVVRFDATTLWHLDAAEWAPSTASSASRLAGIRLGVRTAEYGRRSWAWWQLLDTACVHLRQRIAHTPARDQPLRRDFRERRQHEGASEQLRMRQREVRPPQNEIIVSDEVDIDRTRAPAAFLGALASERALDRLRPSQKRARRQGG